MVFSIALVYFCSRNMQQNNNIKLAVHQGHTRDSIGLKMLLLLAIFFCCGPLPAASSLDGLQGQSIKGEFIA